MEKGNLYLIATPIGNLEDITLRAINTLKEVDIIAAEDTRHSLKLLNHLNISKPLISYHRHNEDVKTKELIALLSQGKNVGLITDAGTPGISDPGEEVVKQAIENDINIIPIPGACAAINALISSGMSTKEFIFYGFLPLNKKLREEKFEDIKRQNKTIIIYEAPHRIKSTLKEINEKFGNIKIVLAKEITKIHEEFIRGNIEEIINNIQEPKGEYIIIFEIKGKSEKQIEMENLNKLTIEEQYNYYEKMGLNKKEIIKKIAKNNNVPKDTIYKKFI
ncbi:MAG: 16S rRNA (cytidine(1402)-2'-O)-methyltransferase [Christensenellales bacterium]